MNPWFWNGESIDRDRSFSDSASGPVFDWHSRLPVWEQVRWNSLQILVKNVSGQIDVEHFIDILDQVHMNYLILVFHSEKLMLHVMHVYSLIKNMH